MPNEINKYDVAPQIEEITPENSPYGGGGWPGDGSGEDDLADYNQNEANDYSDEG